MSNSGIRLGSLRRTVLGAAFALSLGLLLLALGAFSASPSRGAQVHRGAQAHQADAIGFSHAVIVDQQRPGFEPDVKVDSAGQIYSSVPFGFSTTQSFVWSSRDGGNSYQFVPGTIGPGKPSTCVGGGDTDLFLDSANALYFSDLQGLTNISNSMSTDGGSTWSTSCAGAPNTPDDRMWFTGTGSSKDGNLQLFQDYDAVNSSAGGGNQLVETMSTGGTVFQPVVNKNPSTGCAGAGLVNCVTNNEGISGNQVADPANDTVYIAHTTTNNSSGTPGVQVSEGKITPGTPATPPMATWTESPNLDAKLCGADTTCADSFGNPEEIAGENFASIARDSAGYLYVAFTAGPLDHDYTCNAVTCTANDHSAGALTNPEQIYVVHSTAPAPPDPTTSTIHWSDPQAITGGGISAGTNTFPWITAGSDGRVAVAWYHTDETSEQGPCPDGSGATCTLYGASSLSNAEWSVQLGQSLNAHDANPTYALAPVSQSYVKQGSICTNGLGCASGGDRSLGDFLQVSTDQHGAALVSYVFDTSANTSAGENAGPEVISRQISGPSLFASEGSASQGNGPGVPMGSVSDPTGDAYLSQNGTRTPAGDNLDLTGASLANGPNRTLVARIKVKSLSSLAPQSGVGGPDASWILRWTDVTPGTTGNGDIYYVGMDNNQGAGGSGSPTFFAGDTAGIPPSNGAEHTKYMTFPQTHLLSSSQASYNSKTGEITINVPLSDVGNPADGKVLYSATAFSATSTSPQSSTNLFNLTDATTPFELVIGAPGTVGTTPSGPPRYASPNNSRRGACAKATGSLTGIALGRLRLGMTRTTARRIYGQWSTRGRRYMEFYCVSPNGIRAGYPSTALLHSLSGKERRRVQGRAVLLLTANRRYALRGAHPGARLSKFAKRLGIGRPFKVGANTWYVTSNGASHGVIKVRRGIIEEVGIADKRLTSGYRQAFRFLNSFRPYL